ncbi:LysR family transcriptional regulator [Oceanibacterium hippocampi]|uniref:HTH-type transcriptional regulator LeuO n=1 Tax=Oceanibacterium hippocampi TaxID=745714 RepID=A0A1Y5TZU0_9PROT|nr:LysR family transcriptional regulator [Oceanibacterium hippocampi]SLN77407.1 HTH-type transcriptional regulator LeuO [Oceanibacterium hippocampi]
MNFATFDLNLLRVLDALFREENATRAGDRLRLSQPAVSAALNRLRRHLDDPLFVRQKNRMVPTAKALALKDTVREALVGLEEAMTAIAGFDPASARRCFRIYGSDYFADMLMPALSATLRRAAPGIVLQLIDNSSGDMQDQLADRAADLALEPATAVPAWISCEPAFHSSFVVVAAADNPAIRRLGLQEGEEIPLDAFCAMPQTFASANGQLAGIVDKALAVVGRRREASLTLPQFHSVAVAVAEGTLVATLPRAIATKYAASLGLRIYAAPVAVPPADLRLYWHVRHDADMGHQWLRARVKAILAGYDEGPGSARQGTHSAAAGNANGRPAPT